MTLTINKNTLKKIKLKLKLNIFTVEVEYAKCTCMCDILSGSQLNAKFLAFYGAYLTDIDSFTFF